MSSDFDNRLFRLFNALDNSNFFTDEEVEKVFDAPFDNWDKFWMLVSMGMIGINLISRKYPIKTSEDIYN